MQGQDLTTENMSATVDRMIENVRTDIRDASVRLVALVVVGCENVF